MAGTRPNIATMNTHIRNARFHYSIPPTVVQLDRERQSFENLHERGLRYITQGKIVLELENPHECLTIDSEVLDYAVQLKGAIQQLDSGASETFCVSGDYFSNNIRLTYIRMSKAIEIYKANGGSFCVQMPYHEFRLAFFEFYSQMLSELQAMYPELAQNKNYLTMVS